MPDGLKVVNTHIVVPPPEIDGSMKTNTENMRALSGKGVRLHGIGHALPGQEHYYDELSDFTGARYFPISQAYEYEGKPPSQERIYAIDNDIRGYLSQRNGDKPAVAVIGHESWVWHAPVFREYGIPTVVRLLGTPTRALKEDIYDPDSTQRFIDSMLGCDYILPLSYHFQGLVEEFADAKGTNLDGRVHQFYDGTELERFRPAPKDMGLLAKYGIPQDNIVISHASGHFPVKRVQDIVESANMLFTSHPELRDRVTYVIAGKGPETEKIAKMIEQSPYRSNFRLPGPIPHEEMHNLYNISDIFVFASENEGLGRVVIEAQACGVYPIVSSMPVGYELTLNGRVGTNFERRDPQDLAEKTYHVLTMPKGAFDERRFAGRDHVMRTCDFGTNMAWYHGFLHEVADKGVGYA